MSETADAPKPSSYNRRLSDKILVAFDQACAQQAVEVAELLMQALELALTREGGAGATEKRHDMTAVLAAFEKMKGLEKGDPTA